jgi:hypothetical protein
MRGHQVGRPENPARDSKGEATVYIGVGTLVVILIIVLIVFLIRR